MFKRIKTIGLLGIGLLAMLGTKAEAHYVYYNGHWYYHSVGCQVEIGSMETAPATVKCVVTPTLVETLCTDLSIVTGLTITGFSIEAQVQEIEPDNGQATVEVSIDPDDDALLQEVINLYPLVCGGTPIDALIRSMASTVTIYKCVGSSDPCSSLLLTYTKNVTCALPSGCTLDECPNNEYTCTVLPVGGQTHEN